MMARYIVQFIHQKDLEAGTSIESPYNCYPQVEHHKFVPTPNGLVVLWLVWEVKERPKPGLSQDFRDTPVESPQARRASQQFKMAQDDDICRACGFKRWEHLEPSLQLRSNCKGFVE